MSFDEKKYKYINHARAEIRQRRGRLEKIAETIPELEDAVKREEVRYRNACARLDQAKSAQGEYQKSVDEMEDAIAVLRLEDSVDEPDAIEKISRYTGSNSIVVGRRINALYNGY